MHLLLFVSTGNLQKTKYLFSTQVLAKLCYCVRVVHYHTHSCLIFGISSKNSRTIVMSEFNMKNSDSKLFDTLISEWQKLTYRRSRIKRRQKRSTKGILESLSEHFYSFANTNWTF